jgi:RHS repeat-associated protein
MSNSGSSKTFTYDANANLTSDGTRAFEWDAVNRLVAVTIGTHRSEITYDGFDRRVRIVEKESGSTIRDARFVWSSSAIVEERLSTGEITRFFSDAEDHNGTARYLTRDHLGSVRELTDSASALVTRNEYDPYGRLTKVDGTEDTRFGFTGHYWHRESGFPLPLFRAYDPTLGQWLSDDPLGLRADLNLHRYVGSDPVRNVDPSGLWTASFGSTFSGPLGGGMAGSISVAVNVDSSGGMSLSVSPGAGKAIGLSATNTWDISISDAQGVCDLGGFFANLAVKGGWGPAISATGFGGNSPHGRVHGITFGFGEGAGASTSDTVTNTRFWKF